MSSLSTRKNIGKDHNIHIPEDKGNNAGLWEREVERKFLQSATFKYEIKLNFLISVPNY